MKTILLTQRVECILDYNERRDAIDQRYVAYILSMGFLPYIVPNVPDVVTEIMDTVNVCGLFLSGGNSLLEYGGDAPERDYTERKLVDICFKKNIPILGVCRGAQILAHYYIGARLTKVDGHSGIRHDVSGEITGNMNSYHDWGIEPFINNEYKILSSDSKGYVEAFMHIDKPILGIMWHPEREENINVSEQKQIKNFFETGKLL